MLLEFVKKYSCSLYTFQQTSLLRIVEVITNFRKFYKFVAVDFPKFTNRSKQTKTFNK